MDKMIIKHHLNSSLSRNNAQHSSSEANLQDRSSMIQNNKRTNLFPVLISSASMLFFSCTTSAFEKGDIIVRAGPANVSPDASSSNINVNGTDIPGTSADVEDNTQLGIIATYMLSNHLGVSVLASTPFKHDIKGENIGINDIGSTKHLPPTLTLDYFPLKSSNAFQPHIGLGLNYTVFFSDSTSSEFNAALGDSSLDLDNSFGLALKAGFDYQINDKFGISATVYRIDIDTDATIDTFNGTEIKVDVDIDPYVYMLGATYKF